MEVWIWRIILHWILKDIWLEEYGHEIWPKERLLTSQIGPCSSEFVSLCPDCLVGKPEVKRPHGRPKLRWEDIKIDLKEIFWKDDGSGLGQAADSPLRGNEHSDSTNCALFLNQLRNYQLSIKF